MLRIPVSWHIPSDRRPLHERERHRDAEIVRLTREVEYLRERVNPRAARRAELAESDLARVTEQLDRVGSAWPGTWPWERVKQLVDDREACPACNPAEEGLVDRAYALFTSRYREEFPAGGDARDHEEAQHAAIGTIVAALSGARADEAACSRCGCSIPADGPKRCARCYTD